MEDDEDFDDSTVLIDREDDVVRHDVVRHIVEEKQQWPFLFWVYLKVLGLYRPGPFVTIRRCAECNDQGFEKFASLSSFVGPCEICESFLWDHQGRVVNIKDQDIGAERLNHRGSSVISALWLFVILGSTLFLIGGDIFRFQNDKDDIVEFIATICIQLLLTIPPFASVSCNLYTTWPHCAPGKWAGALSPVFLVQRLRCVNMRHTRAAGYSLFFISIFFIVLQCSGIVNDIYAYGKDFTYLTPFDYFTLIVGIFNFAGMAYVAYLLRKSYEKEVRLICKFLKEQIDDIDLCRLRLAETFDSYHLFREFTSGWLCMNIVLGTICILLELHSWIVTIGPMKYFRYERLIFLVSCFALPLLAIGNVSADYLWYRMVRRISRLRRKEREMNWDKIMQFLQEQRPGDRPWQSVMAFLLSVIAVFAAIQFRLMNSKAINSAFTMHDLEPDKNHTVN